MAGSVNAPLPNAWSAPVAAQRALAIHRPRLPRTTSTSLNTPNVAQHLLSGRPPAPARAMEDLKLGFRAVAYHLRKSESDVVAGHNDTEMNKFGIRCRRSAGRLFDDREE